MSTCLRLPLPALVGLTVLVSSCGGSGGGASDGSSATQASVLQVATLLFEETALSAKIGRAHV